MFWLILVFAGGIGALVYGIWEQKNVYGNPQFAEAKVVGHGSVRSSHIAMTAVNAIAGIVNPIVSIELPDGTTKDVPLHNQVMRTVFQKYPELDVGGTVSVTYFGTNPKEAFLTGHPLAQKPMTCSPVLLIGIIIWACVIGMTVLYFCIR